MQTSCIIMYGSLRLVAAFTAVSRSDCSGCTYTFSHRRSSRKQSDFCFIARPIPLSLLKTKLCQQRLPQFGVSSPSCKGSKIRQCLARAADVLYSAGLAAADAGDLVSCDVCPAKRERIDNVSHVITESCRLCVRGNRRTHRAQAEETARHRPSNWSNLTGICCIHSQPLY